MISPTYVLQNTIPPALLSYYFWGWRRLTNIVGHEYLGQTLGHPYLGALYTAGATLLIGTTTIVFLRLYFLPASQSVPPRNPRLADVFECTPPPAAIADGYAVIPGTDDALEDLIPRCTRDTCAGRWKPPRARHCSECGTCRAGFDHHCAFFANCLTAPYLPAFLCLMMITPITVTFASIPLYVPLLKRAAAAWAAAKTAPEAVRWWGWWPSWIVAFGPVGRWVVGLALGWRQLDRDGGRHVSLEIAAIVAIGNMLSAMTMALGYSSFTFLRSGSLTVDKERLRAHARALAATDSERARRFAPLHWFCVRLDDCAVVLSAERPYDLGPRGNFAQIVGKWSALLPWNALRRGIAGEVVFDWPVAPRVREWLLAEAERIAEEEEGDESMSVPSAPRRPGPDRIAYTRL